MELQTITDICDMFVNDKIDVITNIQLSKIDDKYIKVECTHTTPPEHTILGVSTKVPDKSLDDKKTEAYPASIRIDEYVAPKHKGYLTVSEFIFDGKLYQKIIDTTEKGPVVKQEWQDV